MPVFFLQYYEWNIEPLFKFLVHSHVRVDYEVKEEEEKFASKVYYNNSLNCLLKKLYHSHSKHRIL